MISWESSDARVHTKYNSLMVCEVEYFSVRTGFLIKSFLFLYLLEGGRVVKGGGL